MIDYIIGFFLCTYVIYWMHRFVHANQMYTHLDHHHQVTNETIKGFHWTNLFLWFDSLNSTIDQWMTEVIPVFFVSFFTGLWGLFVAYYIWAAFLQERIEHDPNFDWFPFITSGKWHLIHHKHPNKNFGVFHPLWDILHGTYMDHTQSN